MLDWILDKIVAFIYRNDDDPWMVLDWDENDDL